MIAYCRPWIWFAALLLLPGAAATTLHIDTYGAGDRVTVWETYEGAGVAFDVSLPAAAQLLDIQAQGRYWWAGTTTLHFDDDAAAGAVAISYWLSQPAGKTMLVDADVTATGAWLVEAAGAPVTDAPRVLPSGTHLSIGIQAAEPSLPGILIPVAAAAAVAAAWALLRRRRSATPAMAALEHVEELRRRLMGWAITVFAVTAAAFSIRIETAPWAIAVDAQENFAAQVFTVIATHLIPEGVQLVVTRPSDGIVAQMAISLAVGLTAALPIMAYHITGFMSPALTRSERRVVRRTFFPFLGFFAAGMTFCWLAVLPILMRTLYGYGAAIGAQPLVAAADLVGFAVTMLVVFGFAFQMPLVMFVAARVGLATWRGMLAKWRHAFVAILIFAALVTDPTVVSQLLVAGPLFVLYGLGILAARWGQRAAASA